MRRPWLAVGASVAALGLAACGSSDSSGGSTGTEAAGGSGADVAAAKAVVARYAKAPTAFPVDVPLKSAPSPSWKLAQLNSGTPTGALIAQLLDAGAKVAGVQMVTEKAGITASGTQSAATAMLASDPDAILLPATNADLFSEQLAEMERKEVVVGSAGIMDPKKYGIDVRIFDERTIATVGKVLANWVVATKGDSANVLYYGTPELSFSAIEQAAFADAMKARCPSCTVRYAQLSASTFGSTAPSKVVSTLQGAPKTNTVVFGSAEAAVGLPSALKVAGLHPTLAGFGVDPGTLNSLKSGDFGAVFAFDVAVAEWTTMDGVFRALEGLPLTSAQEAGLPPLQLLLPETVKDLDISRGYSAFPDFAARFAKLWRVGTA